MPLPNVFQRVLPHGVTDLVIGTIEITRVEPARPVENQPVDVFYKITSLFKPLSGTIVFNGVADDTLKQRDRIDELPEGQSVHGRVQGIAPGAARGAEIRLDFYDDDATKAGVEFPPPAFYTSTSVDVAARYQLQVDWFKVDNPRSLRNDTILGSCTVLFGDNPLPNPHPGSPFDVPKPTQAFDFKDHGGGDVVPTPFAFGPFESVPGLPPDLTFDFVFLNAGYAASGEEQTKKVLDTLSDVGAAIASAAIPAAAAIFPLVNQAHKESNAAFLSSCDGTVAADKITMMSDALAGQTANEGTYSETRHYTGTSSPVICGETSNYDVKFSIVRLSHHGL
jgi:hypothetical protein